MRQLSLTGSSDRDTERLFRKQLITVTVLHGVTSPQNTTQLIHCDNNANPANPDTALNFDKPFSGISDEIAVLTYECMRYMPRYNFILVL